MWVGVKAIRGYTWKEVVWTYTFIGAAQERFECGQFGFEHIWNAERTVQIENAENLTTPPS